MGHQLPSEQAREMRAKSRGSLGYLNPTKRATEHPTIRDIAWAAGIFEGEGCASRNNYNSQFANVSQKYPWLIERLRSLFGGSVRKTVRKESWRGLGKAGATYWHWEISGARCRGFLMTIYPFLSPRRKEQVKWTLGNQTKEEYLAKSKTLC